MEAVGERLKATCKIPDRNGKLKIKKPEVYGKYFLIIKDPIHQIISR
jgi:hypothetical protein